jgi:uncharacterized protein
MSEENIPHKVDPFRFADNGLRLQGSLPVKNMSRLCESLYDCAGDIKVNIGFEKNEQGTPFLKGELLGVLLLQCQRCMDRLPYEITHKFELNILHSEEEAETLPQGYDAIIAKDDILIVQDMVEDELIINLPVVPMHTPKDCKVVLPLMIESEQVDANKENPFKVIEFLRTKRDSQK